MNKYGMYFFLGLIVFLGLVRYGYHFYTTNLNPSRTGVMPTVKPSPEITFRLGTNTTGLPLTLGKGVSISIFAKDLGNPRVLTWDPRGTLLVSLTENGKVVALPDEDHDGLADGTVTVASGLTQPHGLAFHNGQLYIAETNAVSVYDYDQTTHKAMHRKKIVDLPGGGNHFSRTIAFGPDGKLYIAIGSTCNVCTESDSRRASMMVANADGSDVKTYAQGLRNTVFFAWHPVTGELWGTDMGRDYLGDDLPPDEINIIKPSKDYGWPTCYGKQIADTNFAHDTPPEHISPAGYCKSLTEPSYIDIPAHSAPLGLAFFPGNGWPAEYKNNLLVAYHGSWNRSIPTGYKVVRYILDDKGNYRGVSDFISGFAGEGGVLGRPVDLLFASEGTLYLSDDKAGNIYRITASK